MGSASSKYAATLRFCFSNNWRVQATVPDEHERFRSLQDDLGCAWVGHPVRLCQAHTFCAEGIGPVSLLSSCNFVLLPSLTCCRWPNL
jgi:hypothetical protein